MLNNMQGLSLQQLQTMGATPIAPTTAQATPQTGNQSGGLSLQQLQTMGAKPVNQTPGILDANINGQQSLRQEGQAIADSAKSGWEKVQEGFKMWHEAGYNPLKMLQSGWEGAKGVAEIATSPLAPVFQPVNQLVESAGDAISNIPAVQKFANSPAGGTTAKIAKEVSESAGLLGTVGALAVGPEVARTKGEPIPEEITKPTPSEPGITPEEINRARGNVAEAYKKSIPLTPSEQIKEAGLLSKTGDNVYTTMAKWNIPADSEAAIPQLEAISEMYQKATDMAKNNEHAYFNVDELKQNALKSVEDNLSSETEREMASKKITDELDALKNKNQSKYQQNAQGQYITQADIIERVRKTGNDWAKYGKNKFSPDTVKEAAGRALANAARDQVEKEGTFKAYREVSREWGKVIHAQEVLQKISDSGKQFKQVGGLSGTIARRVLSGALGWTGGGFVGAVVSELGQETVFKILSNPDLRTYFDRKLLSETSDGKISSDAVDRLVKEVENHVKSQKELLQLPPAKTIMAEAPKGTPSFRTVNAERISIKNPETGKYEKAYTSQERLNAKNAPTNPPSKNSNIIRDNTTTKLKGKQGGYVNPDKMLEDIKSGVSNTVSRLVHPDDIEFLKTAINYYRGISEISDKQFDRTYEMVNKLGINMNQPNAKIASSIEKFLNGNTVPGWLRNKSKK